MVGSAEELLDEDNHFSFFNGSGTIFVEGSEDLIESFIGEFITTREVSECILNEFLCFFFVEGTGVVYIISSPDLVDHTWDSLFFGSCHLKKIESKIMSNKNCPSLTI